MKSSKLRSKTSIHAHIIRILESEKKPMTVKELTKLIQMQRTISSKRPTSTVSAILQRSEHVKKVGKATFSLNKNIGDN